MTLKSILRPRLSLQCQDRVGDPRRASAKPSMAAVHDHPQMQTQQNDNLCQTESFFPPSLFYSTEQILIQSRFKSSTAETGTQFPWHYCPLLSALVLEWHWTHHQTVLSACLILSGLKTSTSVVDKSHDMQEEVDNEAITVLFFFIHYYWEGFIFFHVILH